MLNPEIISILREAGIDLRSNSLSRAELESLDTYRRLSKQDPDSLVAKLMQANRRADRAEKNCAKASEAATKLEEMLKDLLQGPSHLYRLESIRRGEGGLRAICHAGNQFQEFPVHPEVDIECLEKLDSWEYVRICENVVVGTWADDPVLFASALGEVVAFTDYHDRELGLVQVSEQARNQVVRLATDLRDQEIAGNSKLVLQRDDPGRAIAVVPGQQARSKFEVPIEQIDTRIEDLAGIEPIAQQLIEEVVVNVLNPSICEDFGLQPMKGFLLSSYKPGMAKTAFARAFAYWLYELGLERGFDVLLYFVPPNATKNLFHGEDARIVREDLFGPIHERQRQPRERALFQFVVLDEVDCLGKRTDANHAITSSAQSDALEAMLSEMDGLIQNKSDGGPPAYILIGGMTNLPERVDEALKRPGRLGDLDLEMPDISVDGAEDILAIYARGNNVAWYVDGEIRRDLDEQEVRSSVLRPALASTFSSVVLRYSTADSQRRIDVTAGEILAGVHFKEAMGRAKKQAALRLVQGVGVPAVGYDDVVGNLAKVAQSTARQMAADKNMLIRQLRVQVGVARIDVVPREELEDHRYLHVYSA
jgi:ATP-dependent 26S proteasome regulatory subunit